MEQRKERPNTAEPKTHDSLSAHPIDSSQLRAFEILARTKSFTETASELHLSQSAISRAMQALEEDLGCKLFNRKEKPISLTPVGEQLLARAGKILREMTAARAELSRLHERELNHLRIGADPTICLYVLPTLLPQFAGKFPSIRVTIEPVGTEQSAEALRKNEIDFAIGLEPQSPESLDFHYICTDELVLVVSPSHSFVSAGKAEPRELAGQNFIFHSATSQKVIEFLGNDVEVSPLHTSEDLGVVKQLVKLNAAITILPRWVIQNELAEHSLEVLPLGRRKLKRNWGLLYSRGKLLSSLERSFAELCKAVLSDVVT